MQGNTFNIVNIHGTKAVQLPDSNGCKVFKEMTFKSPIVFKIKEGKYQELFDLQKIRRIGKVTREELAQAF